jgi:hypothetical protein
MALMATWVAMRALAPATGSGFATPASRPRRQMATWVAMAALALEDRKAPSVRPGQLEEMVSMVAMAAMALEDREASSGTSSTSYNEY